MNNLKPEHQTQAVFFPDVNPSDLPENAQFSMAAGDFLEVGFMMYKKKVNVLKVYFLHYRFIQKIIIGTVLQHVFS